MIKKQISLGCLFLAMSIHAQNQTTEHAFEMLNNNIKEYFYVSSDWGDYDNDGDLDLLISGVTYKTVNGELESEHKTEIYQNNNGSFDPIVDVVETPRSYGSVKFLDFDNDGDLDFAITGIDKQSTPQRVLDFYENKNGVYSLKQSVDGAGFSSLDIGDVDNDGDLDILITGYTLGYGTTMTKVYYNNNATFVDSNIDLEPVHSGDARFIDIDNDQDLDIILMGSQGYEKILKVYENENTDFTLKENLDGLADGSIALADYDADGDLDFAIMGTSNNYRKTTKIYKNTNGYFIEAEDLLGMYSNIGDNQIAWGDYDNDGDYDLIYSGKNGSYEIATELYKNTANGMELAEEGIFESGVDSSINWVDIDQDNDLDLFISGTAFDVNEVLTAYNNIYRNNTVDQNHKPEAPTNLSISLNEDEDVTFSWDLANDDKTPAKGLYYILNIGTTEGATDIASYKVYGTKWKIKKLGLINFHWSVQAVDASFVSSDPTKALALAKIQLSNSEFSIYPNPVKEYIYLKNNANIQIKSLVIYDMTMRKIAQMKVDSKDKIKVDFLNKGMYILQFKTNDATIVRKLIKQ